MRAPQPTIGQWYRISGEKAFEVVAVDEEAGTIEIQYFDGTLGELDREDWDSHWLEGQIAAAAQPEDGSVDVESDEDNTDSPPGNPDLVEQRELP